MTSQAAEVSLPPVRQAIEVRRSTADAFRIFTEGIGSWWPLATHSVGGAESRCVFESGLGGAIYEETANGERHAWGTVRLWEPPARVCFTWHPGRGAETAQEVELTFTENDGRTRVELVHRGWEVLGPEAEKTRAGYETGWAKVFGEHYFNGCEGT
ncbi:MAG: SRPBCC domain-containing protein [Acidobacteriota bacterium]